MGRPVNNLLGTTVVTLVLVVGGAAADDCVDYTDYLHTLGTSQSPTNPRDLAVAGDLAFLPDDDATLHVIDLADPANPHPVGQLATAAPLLRVAAAPPWLYLTDVDARLLVIDVSDPAQPVLTDQRDLPAAGRGLDLDFGLTGELLLIGCGEAGLAVLDLADPADPRLLATLDTPGYARGVAADGALAAVADGDAGLRAVDLTDPGAPRLLGALVTAGPAVDVALHGAVAQVACDGVGLEMVALVDPATPASLAVLPLPGLSRRLASDGAITHLTGPQLSVVDVSDPLGPVLVARAVSDLAVAVAAAPGRAYLADARAGLVILDASVPANPAPISVTATGATSLGLAVDGRYTYLADAELFVYDHADPAQPRLVGTAIIPGTASRVALVAGHAYVTSAGVSGLLEVVDIADPTQPEVVAEVEFPGYPGPILAHDGVLYLGDFLFGGLYVLDLADPAAPELLPTIETAPYAIALAASDELLYVSTGAFGGAAIQIFDLADPLAPVLVHTWSTDQTSFHALAARGNLLLATPDGQPDNGLTILDLSVPTAPSVLAHLPLPGDPRALALGGDVAYLAGEEGYLQVVDVSEPAAPFRLGQTPLPAAAFTLATAGDRVHAAATTAGLAILPGHCAGGVGVLDPGDPGDPGDPDDPDAPPASPTALTAHPNPFNPRVTLRFFLPRAEAVSLEIFDLAGRRVDRLLADDPRAAGHHAVTWQPRRLPSGTYLARLATASLTRTAKLVLAR